MKKYKIIISFVFCFTLLLLSSSYAFYFQDNFNFLTGISPFYNTGEMDWEGVYFYPQDGVDNKLQGSVVSFNNNIMTGSQPSNSIPLINSSHITGKVVEVPAGHCVAINLFNSRLYGNREFSYSILGYGVPLTLSSIDISTLSVANEKGMQVAYDNNGAISTSTLFSTIDSCYIGTRVSTSTMSTSSSQILLIVNDADAPLYLSNEAGLVQNTTPVVTYDMPTLPNDEVCVLFYELKYGNSISSTSGYLFAIPHIDGAIDIYTPQYKNLYIDNSLYFGMAIYDNVICSIGTTEAGSIYYGIDNKNGMRTGSHTVNISLANSDKNSSYVPYWINSVYTTQKQAIWIKNGYVAITNYDELIAKLREAGIGQTDLSRIISLLEEINTGGDTGAAVKELISILESYHQQIQNSANFSGSTGVFDTYKNILEFTEDMHWLVSANNALFEYFAGFIMLCAMFLFLSRVMR